MVKIVAKGFFYEDKTDEAIKAYEELVMKSREENGCIAYNLYQDRDDKTILAVIEEWESEDHLEKHSNTEHFKKLVPLISTFRKEKDMNIYELVL